MHISRFLNPGLYGILMLRTLLLRNILCHPPCDKHASLGTRGQGLVGGRGEGQVGGRAKEGRQKRGHRKNSDPSSYHSRERQGIQSPILPKSAIHIGICACALLLYLQKGQAIHIGSPTLPNQLRHDNKPVGMVSLFFSFPWHWRPSILSSTDTSLALAILAVL